MIKKFTYKKENGEVSDREVFIITEPSDNYFGLDLTEKTKEEKNTINDTLGDLYDIINEYIVAEGLDTKYRTFKKDRIL